MIEWFDIDVDISMGNIDNIILTEIPMPRELIKNIVETYGYGHNAKSTSLRPPLQTWFA